MLKNYFKIKIFCCLLFIGGFFIFPLFVFGANGDVVINELMWMGSSASSKDEWIELRNMTSHNIDLSGWTIEGAARSGGTLTIPEDGIEHIIPANGLYLISYYSKTDNLEEVQTVLDVIVDWRVKDMGNISLANSNNGDLILKDGGGVIIEIVEGDIWPAGEHKNSEEIYYSMERNNIPGDGALEENWHTCSRTVNLVEGAKEYGTPKSANSDGAEVLPEETPEEESTDEEEQTDEISTDQPTTLPNQPPTSGAGTDITALVGQEILFDGSLSSDPNNDALTYFWNFGDGATDTEQAPKHTYLYPGQYIASLLVDDGEFSDLDIITVNIYNQSVIISEFMPDPEGKDQENEWIELFNQSAQIANLSGWQLDDQDGGSSPFTFPANSLISPNQFLVLIRPITKISLNNDNDQVRLFYPDGSLSAEVGYLAEKKQGFSIAFDGSDYFWTKIPTPGSANIISSSNLDAKEENLSSNNPEPVIQQTQDMPENAVSVNLSQSQSFSALNAPVETIGNIENKKTVISDENNQEINNPQHQQQTASLTQSAQSNQKSKLILIISIIISSSLFVSWILILLSKKRTI